MKEAFKLFTVLALVFGLAVGCSNDKLTSVDPSDLNDMTNGFTTGSGDIPADLSPVLSQGTLMAYGDDFASNYMPTKVTGTFKDAFEPTNNLYVPFMNKIVETLYTFAMIGRPVDPSGNVTKILGIENAFNNPNMRITLDELSEGAPDCVYIDGLPDIVEEYILAGDSSMPEWTEADWTAFAEAIVTLLEDFDITIGFTDTCVLIEDGDNSITAQGSVNIKGFIKIENENEISSKITTTLNDIVVDYDTPTLVWQANGTGNTVITIDSMLAEGTDGCTFNFDYAANAFDITVAMTPEGAEEATNLRFYHDGGFALDMLADGVDIADYGVVTTKPVFQVDMTEYLPTVVPDACNMTITAVLDMTFAIIDPTEFDVLWGMQVVTENDNDTDGLCGNPTSSLKWVLFLDESTFFIISFDYDEVGYDFVMIITGDVTAGGLLNLGIDLDGGENGCTIIVPEGSSLSADDFTCAWSDAYDPYTWGEGIPLP